MSDRPRWSRRRARAPRAPRAPRASSSLELDERVVERPRPEPGEVDRDVQEADPLAERDDLIAQLDCPFELPCVELEARDGVVESHAELAKSERAQAVLELVDLTQPRGRDLGAVGKPRRQARELRLVPRPQ